MVHYKPVSIIFFNALLAIFGILTTTFESHLPDLLLPIIYGFAIFGAAILISWGAEASEKDILKQQIKYNECCLKEEYPY